MKVRFAALTLALALALTGCASLLEREYVSARVHPQLPAAVEDTDVIKVENYQQLVSALFALVQAHAGSGVVRLQNYTPTDGSTAEGDVWKARDEVSLQDPLGRYAIDRMDASIERVVVYYDATVHITYRRTEEQVNAVAEVTGSQAIRGQLRSAMEEFRAVTAFRVNYFYEDAAYIRDLVWQTYLEYPGSALGEPQVEVTLYPETGYRRIIEVNFSYPHTKAESQRRQEAVDEAARAVLDGTAGQEDWVLADSLMTQVTETAAAHQREGQSPDSTAYCLVEGAGDSLGQALGYKLLCDKAGLECQVVEGTLNETAHYWTIVTVEEEARHMDPSLGLGPLTDEALTEQGLQWNRADYPACERE